MSIITEGVDDVDSPALVCGDDHLSWRRLDRLIDDRGAALRRDVAAGGRVGVYARNGIDMAVVHMAGLLASVAVVPINPDATPTEAARLIELGDITTLFVDRTTAARAAVAVAALDPARRPALVGLAGASDTTGSTGSTGSTEGDPAITVVDVDDWAGDQPAPALPADLAPCPPVIFTSGTTGTPKATMLPPASFAGATTTGQLQTAMRQGTFGDTSVHLIVGPLHHTGPLSGLRTLLGGSRVVIMERFDAAEALRLIELHRVEAMVAVPTHFIRMLALPAPEREAADVSSLRRVSHTGASCPVGVKRAMIDWWGPILDEAYGASESGTVARITSPEWLERPGSVGRAIDPFEAVVVDDDGQPLGPGQEGRLYFSDRTGRGITYIGDPDKTAAAHLAPGVFTLGEIGYVDHDGFIFITDRSADMVVSGGVNIYPAESEQALADHPAVADVACVGIPHPDMGERLVALVVPHPGTDTDPDELVEDLVAHCRDRLARYKCPREIEIVDTIPRSSMGKIDKRSLAADLVRRRTPEPEVSPR